MRRQIHAAIRKLRSLPRACTGTERRHTPRGGPPPGRRVAAIALSFLLVASLVVPIAFAGTAAAAPAGMVGVPDSNVSEDFPVGAARNASLRASEIEGSVMASEYANTLEVIVTTPERARGYLGLNDTAALSGDRGLALVLRDETHSQGRQVAIDAGAVRDALGHTPKLVYGTHDDGSEWTSTVAYQAGMLVFEVPHFSTNTVTFSGEVSLTGTYTDGSTVNYDLSSTDSVSNFSINVTGKETSETDTESGSVSDGGSLSLSIAGNKQPSDASVTVSAPKNPDTVNHLSQWGDGTTESNIEVTNYNFEIEYEATKTGVVSSLTFNFDDVQTSTRPVVDIYLVKEGLDATYGEGTLVANDWSPTLDAVPQTVQFSTKPQISQGTIYTIEIVPSTGTSMWVLNDKGPSQARISQNGNNLTRAVDVEATIIDKGANSVSVSGDSSVSFGDIAAGGSKTKTVPISSSTSGLSVSYSNRTSAVNVDAQYDESQTTIDPSVTVNGHTTGYSGTLSAGQTTSLTANKSWINSTNTVDVSVGDGTLSADAPAPSVGLYYSHNAQDEQSVNYSAEKWSESYNVSKTFASDRSSASLTVPFDGDVAKIKTIETRTNGGSWSTVSTDNYQFDGTKLTVQLGSVSAGDEVAVRTTGRKVNVINGGITVLEPTLMGERLDTKFEIDSWGSDAYLSLGNTPDGRRINYLYKESWSNADEYATITADGYHKLYAPGASAGSSARVSTIPVTVNPKSGEVRVSVDDPLRDEPKFHVAPGASAGDAVEFTFIDAKDDTSYALYSVTRDTTVAQGTANSPLTLSDDDSEETLQFQLDDSGTLNASSGGGSFWSGSGSGPVIPAMPVLNPGLVVVIVLGIIAGAIGYQQRRVQRADVPDRPVWRSPLVLLAIVVALFIGILLISPETVTTWLTLVIAKPLSNALNAALPLAGVLGVMAAIGMVVYWWWTRRQAKTAEAATPDTVLRINAKDGDK